MANLVVQNPPALGTVQALVYTAANLADTIQNNDGKTWLHVKNGGGGAITVTITGQVLCNQGSIHNGGPVSIAAGQDAMIGPFPPRFNDVNGAVQIVYSGVTTVTAAAIRTA